MFTVDEMQLEMISSYIYAKFGIYIGKDKYERLGFRLTDMINRGICSSVAELCARLSSGDSRCFEQLAGFVTTCHTFFFREPEHFRILVSDIRKHRKSGIFIWCAACSTGEEPYSAAITLLEAGITDFHIIATDVNRDVLGNFNKGVYHESRFIRTDNAVRDRYFTPEEDSFWRIDGNLRRYISIKNLNLMDNVQFPRLFDYVFCRNVFIYFDEKSRETALTHITANMKSGGLLFIGHAEVLLSEPANLKKVESSIYYRTE
ncbi:MAG: protein-glutamate O-methyltransferase CheR [Treponema sp.]|nr:protein-glutamate O-methyltransferase CheR [Treponema sp.]